MDAEQPIAAHMPALSHIVPILPEAETPVDALRRALRRHDAQKCQRLAEEIGVSRRVDAVGVLSDLVQRPTDEAEAWQRQGKKWRWARVAGIRALAYIGRKEALPALVSALSDDDPHVRETASFEITAFGEEAIPALRKALRQSEDWSPTGMQAVIDTLGALKAKSATPELAQVIAEQLPRDPSRWARQPFTGPLYVVGVTMLVSWFGLLMTTPIDGDTSFLMHCLIMLVRVVTEGFIPLLFLYMLLVCAVYLPAMNFSAARERDQLTDSALRALTQIEDKHALYVVIDAAFGPRGHVARTARKTLTTLLPLLDAKDVDLLPDRKRQQLTGALGLHGTGLDLAILRSLEFIGTGASVAAVERLASRSAVPAVRAEAKRILPILQLRHKMERSSAILLRPSGIPGLQPEELLRASTETHSAADELLRPDNDRPDDRPRQ